MSSSMLQSKIVPDPRDGPCLSYDIFTFKIKFDTESSGFTVVIRAPLFAHYER